MSIDHLFLAMLDHPEVSSALLACGANLVDIRLDVERSLATHEHIRMPESATDFDHQVPGTVAYWRVIQLASKRAAAAGRPCVELSHVLVELFLEDDGSPQFIMSKHGVSLAALLRAVSHPAGPSTPSFQASAPLAEGKDWLALYAVNLNALATAGRIDPLVGRTLELHRVIQILCRRRKNNPILVGPPGVGKTAIAEGLAARIVAGNIPAAIRHAVVYSLDIGAMLAGTKYRGDFEERIKGVLDQVEKTPNAIVFVDEAHMVIGAGSSSGGGSMDVSNLIKPALSSGRLQMIAATTVQEYRAIERDGALARRFQKVDIGEPSRDDTVTILEGLRPGLESHHGVRYDLGAIESAIDLSIRHLADRLLPDKAIDVLDEAGARARLLSTPSDHVGVDDIRTVVAAMARIPVEQASTDDKKALRSLADRVKQTVFGQDAAIDALAAVLRMNRSGLGNLDKPIGSFLFAGPTGVGKTETVLSMAAQMGLKLLRFDMSEYREAHSVARLLGAPPGYVGHDRGGLLTEAVISHPHCMLLLDEIEKAHPDIFNVLLQVMDAGRLTDATGRLVDFRNTILVMTTNAGAGAATRRSMGFVAQDHASDAMEAIKSVFAPEFRNRLDEIIGFAPLDRTAIDRVVRKLLSQVVLRAREQGVEVSFSESTVAYLAQTGFDPQMGARPMARVIQGKIKRPLSDRLLFDDIPPGSSIAVDVVGDSVVLHTQVFQAETVPASV